MLGPAFGWLHRTTSLGGLKHWVSNKPSRLQIQSAQGTVTVPRDDYQIGTFRESFKTCPNMSGSCSLCSPRHALNAFELPWLAARYSHFVDCSLAVAHGDADFGKLDFHYFAQLQISVRMSEDVRHPGQKTPKSASLYTCSWTSGTDYDYLE